jgi:hypothetical protein
VDEIPAVSHVSTPGFLPRDVHSVVSDDVSGRPSRVPRSQQHASPIVQPYRSGLYHAGGLYPLNIHHPWFKVCSAFSGSQWCDCALTVVERASVFDVPLVVVNTLTHADLEQVLVQPGRMFERCVHTIMSHAGLIDQGGICVFIAREKGVAFGDEQKRSCNFGNEPSVGTGDE